MKTVVSSTNRYILVRIGVKFRSKFRYIQPDTGTYCSVLIFLAETGYAFLPDPGPIPCCNAARPEVLYSRSMQAQAPFNQLWAGQATPGRSDRG
jgi:hypothetical protein